MTELVKEGGRRRLDRVLAPDFADDLESLGLDEVKERRDACRAEREYLSLIRRLLQGRHDILRAESERRVSGAEPEGSMVERLTAILADGPSGAGRGEVVTFGVPAQEIANARRGVERLISDAHLSRLSALSDDELKEAIDRIEQEERRVSDARIRVIERHDLLQGDLKRRFREQYGEAG